MQRINRQLSFTLTIFFFSFSAFSQTGKTISGDFRNMPFAQFVQAVESQSGYRFFYMDAEVDSILVNLAAKNQPLAPILENILKNTGLHYSIDGELNVFIIKRFSIQTRLPDDFFNHKNTRANTSKLTKPEPEDYAEEKPDKNSGRLWNSSFTR